jgi:hypothetical protein
VAAAVLFAIARAGEVCAEDRVSGLERQVKAAFLYKFAGYVEWPAAAFPLAETPVTIGIVNDEEMEDELKKLVAGRTSNGRRVEVVRLKSGEPIPAVHLLFIGVTEEARLKADIRAASGRPILIVTEQEGALQQGSMINFVLNRGRVRFEVALKDVEPARLTLSSRLLSVALAVR